MKETIDRWGKEDGIDTSGVFVRYEDLGKHTLGICRCKWRDTDEGARSKGADIGIAYQLEGHITRYGTLWHEYSHFYEWVIYGTSGHGGNWLKS